MTLALLLLLPAELAVVRALATSRLDGECLPACAAWLAPLALLATAFGVASVNSDPAGRPHVDLGLAYVGSRLVYSLSLAALAFPLSARTGLRPDCEALKQMSNTFETIPMWCDRVCF